MSRAIRRVILLTPTYNEPLKMLAALSVEVDSVVAALRERGIEASHFWLDDGNTSLPEDVPRLLPQRDNVGVARRLTMSYNEVANRDWGTNDAVVICFDAQEHPVGKIPEIVQAFEFNERLRALSIPVMSCMQEGQVDPYWVSPEVRAQVDANLAAFYRSMNPINLEELLRWRHHHFFDGYNAFHLLTLRHFLAAKFTEALVMYERLYGTKPVWAFHLLSIMLTRNAFKPEEVGYLYGGMMTEWKGNRDAAKLARQAKEAERICEVAYILGCRKEKRMDSEPVCPPG